MATTGEQSSYDSLMQDKNANSLELSDKPGQIEPVAEDLKVIPDESPSEPEVRMGTRGYLRMLRIFFSFALFGLRILLNTRDWVGRKREVTSEQRHQEGAMLREKF